MTARTLYFAGLGLMLATAAPVQAVSLVNGGFENGLTGWDTDKRGGQIMTVAEHVSLAYPSRTWQATEGSTFALLRANGLDKCISVSQSFTVGPQTKAALSLDWFLDSNEGFLRVTQADGQAGGAANGETVFEITAPGPSTGGTHWSSQELDLEPGEYQLTAGVVRARGYRLPGYLGIDNVALNSDTGEPTPEPITLLVVFSGAVGLAGYVRRRTA